MTNRDGGGASAPGGAIRILVADDERAVRMMFQEILAEYDVRTVADGSEVMPLLALFRPDIIITDVNMPKENGLSVIRKVKAEHPTVEVLVMTGQARIEEAVEAMKSGAVDFILKPFDIEQMLAAVGKAAERSAVVRENRYLQAANLELARLAELKEKFLRLTSHEMRGPLTVLQGYRDLLPFCLDSPEDVASAAASMSSAIDTLSAVVENVTLLSELGTDRVPIRVRKSRVGETVRRTVEEVSKLAARRNQRITTLISEMPPLGADVLRIGQIVRELLLNAVKFTPDGGGIDVRAGFGESSEWLELTVRDDGIGIDSGKLDLIFEAFYEVQDTRHHSSSKIGFKGGGLGIGLTLVRDLVGAYGGRIGITSEVGRGTRVVVTLPVLPVCGEG